jgi:hypothetical protein
LLPLFEKELVPYLEVAIVLANFVPLQVIQYCLEARGPGFQFVTYRHGLIAVDPQYLDAVVVAVIPYFYAMAVDLVSDEVCSQAVGQS